ncbi:DUF1735 domain-containing protein [Bacteroides fragilis]|uniref:BT_3987 domain-containing protein n=1 Tax=Bacteroides TaxID=816 RepID=UPI00187ADA28|nr:DUF1735 domain-containing protein [Bacteroides fragilis]MBE7399767.1 DUF1735 domain-containing protein [Bacteroides fragilis]MCF2690383.1 DUF1735 domain-containing protein [Bacteroides fragilis]
MKRRIKSTSSILWVLLLILSVSCSKDEIQIVDQDTSWQMDNKYIEEDIREQLGIDPFTDLVYLGYYGKPYTQLEATNDLENTTLVGKNELLFKVKVTKPYKEDIQVNLIKEDKLITDFPEMVEGLPLFPNESCTFEGSVLKAGEMETTVKLIIKDIQKLNNLSGYVMAIKLGMEGAHEHLAIARTRSTYFVKLNLSIRLDNIDSSNREIEGNGFNQELSFTSDIRPDRLGSLNDGNFTANNWYTSNARNYLTIILPERQLLKGFRLDTNTSTSGSYVLKSCRVMVETPDGNWMNHGVFDREVMNGIAYIRFKKPVECTKVRLENMMSFNGRFSVDVNEVTAFR